MAKVFQLEIDGKQYHLKFGYRVLRKLSEHYQIELHELFSFFAKMFPDTKSKSEKFKITNETVSFVGYLIYFGIIDENDFDVDDLVDEFIFNSQDKLQFIMEKFMDSLPKEDEGKGKQQPQKTRQSRKRS